MNDSYSKYIVKGIVAVSLSAILGILVSFVDFLLYQNQSNVLRFIAIILNSPAVWVTVGFVIGVLFKSKYMAMIFAAVGMLALTASYYWFGLNFGDRASMSLGEISSTVVGWMLVALLCGIVSGLIGSFVNTKLRGFAVLALALVYILYSAYRLATSYSYWGNDLTSVYAEVLLGLIGLCLGYLGLRLNKRAK